MSEPTLDLERREPTREEVFFALDQRRAKAYAESGYWPDAKSVAQALVKVEAGREIGITAIEAMSGIHVIEGKPALGADILASLVKASGRYDYRVHELTNERCELHFVDRQLGAVLGKSEFTIKDAATAGRADRPNWKKYPRNMLFARAMSNGVAWYCPDVVSLGRVYVGGELATDVEIEEVPPLPEPLTSEQEYQTADELGSLEHEGEIVLEDDEGGAVTLKGGTA